nr:PAS domain-containing protein [Neptunicella marina]
MIISKTDLQGKIKYANRTFMRVSDFSEKELLGKDHNVIRHPDMPRGVFYGLWKTLKSGKEFFGFVKNRTSSNGYYWVFANITPDILHGQVTGYFSVRRCAPVETINTMEAIYAQMKELEKGANRSGAAEASWSWVEQHIQSNFDMTYEQYAMGLYLKHLKDAS